MKARSGRAALVCFAILLIVVTSLFDIVPLVPRAEADTTPLVFFGASQISVLTGSSVLLTLNLTNVEPTPISMIVHSVIDNVSNNETIDVVNSSETTLQPSLPTIVNMTINNLAGCINYSIAVDVLSTSGAVLTPIRVFYTFPCEIYSQALTLAAPLSIDSSCGPECVNATMTSHLNSTLTAVILAVYQNQAGQTLSVVTSTVTLSEGETASVYLGSLLGALPDVYNATVFAWDTNGVPISPEYSLQFS